jgi:hypothetical protein
MLRCPACTAADYLCRMVSPLVFLRGARLAL